MPYKDKEKRREHHKQYMHSWYRKNRRKHIKLVATSRKKRIERNMAWINAHKASAGCKICGEKDPACLHFHHRNPSNKSFSISSASRNLVLKKLLTEIGKCDVLCANCHAKLHRKAE